MSDRYVLISELNELIENKNFQSDALNLNKLEILYELAAVLDSIFIDSDSGSYGQVNLRYGCDAKIIFDFNTVLIKSDELEKISSVLRKLGEMKIAPINSRCIRVTLTVNRLWLP